MTLRIKRHFGKPFALLLAACLLLTSTGCNALDVFSVDSLLRAPKLTGENARIQKSFEAAVGADVLLVHPLIGSFRSAFVFVDYDADGVDETLVFYAKTEAPGEIHIHFMDYLENEWCSVGDVTGNGSEVYSVDFANVDGDDYREILVAWTVSDSKRNKTLSVYKYDPGKTVTAQETGAPANAVSGDLVLLSVVQIFDYLALDFDFDGMQEILYLSSDTANQSQIIKASVIKVSAETGAFEPLSEVELSRSVEYPLACLYDLRGGNRRVYYDCINFDDTYMTEILEFDSAKNVLIRPQNEAGDVLAGLTLRSEEIYSVKDTDLLVSVPIRYVYEKSYVLSELDDVKTDLFVTEFVRLNNGGFESTGGKYFYDRADRCRVRLDDVFDDFRMEYDVAAHEIRFFDKDDDSGEALFSVRFAVTAEPGQQEDGTAEEETKMPEYEITVSNTAKERHITEETVRDMLEAI